MNTCAQVAVLLHPSVAVYILVLDQLQPLVFTGLPNVELIPGVPPQLSVAVGVPAAGNEVGLHPRLLPAGQEVNPGAV